MTNPESPVPKGTVLIADDERTLRMLMKRAVERDGYESVDVSNGQDCLDHCQLKLPDLILLDAMMPKMGGFECCQRLKQQFGQNCPPILIITTLQDSDSIERAFEMGAEDFITKPIHWGVLRQRIRRLIEAHRATQALQRSLAREHQLSQKLSLQVLEERRLASQLELTNRQLEAANSRLEALANLDGLTQIANRRAFDEQLREQWQRGAQDRTYLSLLIADIDCFKPFNDTYGHQAGDDCLRRVARVISETICRPEDLVARYGGEEFVAVLPQTGREGALAVAQRTLEAVRRLQIPHETSQCGDRVTLSLGVASVIPDPQLTGDDLLKCADRALYLAKTQGRDRVHVASETSLQSDSSKNNPNCQ
ncbi:diguanylate cyclase [Geitlerinema sp. P-1104]|uniref:GGDEF domain-containing response regulator n=1 Tax=Geitlerinema sp. P-1104 TaxID=2546230 RepID=UPI0014771250|nr:diguanylate cyclase [Geitlerinema sp. P-1104]NMG58254.1 diguanylate cyclase [Geitlerinema sp. P-1104]